MAEQKAQIRVGKCIKQGYNYTTSQYPGYTSVRIYSMDKDFGDLSPYHLSDARGRTIENLLQFSKVYPYVNKSIQYKGSSSKQIIWNWPAESHYNQLANIINNQSTNSINSQSININNFKINNLNYNFWKWRRTGFNCDYAIRYPNTYKGRHQPICAIWPNKGMAAEDEYFDSIADLRARPFEINLSNVKIPIYDQTIKSKYDLLDYDLLDYVSARKRIYCGLYAELIKDHPKFIMLKQGLNSGIKLLISEIDGPKYNDYYPYNLVENNSIPFTYDICKYLISDVKYPFGHGYTVAALLMGWDDLITDGRITLGGELNHYTLKSSI